MVLLYTAALPAVPKRGERVSKMTQLKEIYRCNVCGNMVEMVHTGAGELVCCGQPMEKLVAKTEDEGQEKHVPIIEKTDKGVKVKVGSTPHPMEEKHFIEWIELIAGNEVYRQHLKPGQLPAVDFCVCLPDNVPITVREYCNLHGLWQAK